MKNSVKILLMICFASMGAASARACGEKEQSALEVMMRRYRYEEAFLSDLYAAGLDFMDAMRNCGRADPARYCEYVLPLAHSFYFHVQQERLLQQRTDAEIAAAQAKMNHYAEACR